MTARIEDHALLGEGLSAALLAPDARIVWWCAPRFDSAPVYDAILGGAHALDLKVGDDDPESFAYEPHTNIAITRWRSGATAHDFMPAGAARTSIIRLVTASDHAIRGTCGEHAFHVAEGRSAAFRAWPNGRIERLDAPTARLLMLATRQRWRSWSARSTYDGTHRELVERSLLALKALQYRPTGAMIAAPTTSLPEVLGGERNWDYRYAWIRDTAFCMDAFLSCGYRDEAHRLARWILRTVARSESKRFDVMYTVEGGRVPRATHVDLPGYEGAQPVRVGNDAVDQLQLDAYGHIMDCLHLWRALGRREHEGMWPHIVDLVERCTRRWREPDNGIWELPQGRRQLTYSKVMTWVALDRVIRAAENKGRDAPLQAWKDTREAIRKHVLDEGLDDATGVFTQMLNGTHLDAANVRIGSVGFLPPDDARVTATLDATLRRLTRDGFVLRYANDDGLRGTEATFLACTFWLVEALARAQRHEEARELFERAANAAGPWGLYAEEYDPRARRHLGNYPQALTHASLVTAACQLARSSAPTRAPREEADADPANPGSGTSSRPPPSRA